MIRVYENGDVIYTGPIKTFARLKGLNKDTIKKRAIQCSDYKGFHFEYVEEPKPNYEACYLKEKLETIRRFGNTISCRKNIEPLLEYLKENGFECVAKWESKKDGVRGGWLIETERRCESIQERVEKS